MSEPSNIIQMRASTEQIERVLSRPMTYSERRKIIESARLPNGSYDLDSLAVRAFDAHMDEQLKSAKRNIDPEIKYAMFPDVVDPSDRWDVMRVTEDMRSGEANDPMDRVRVESINYNLSLALHPNRVLYTRDLKFFKNLDEVKRFYNTRK